MLFHSKQSTHSSTLLQFIIKPVVGDIVQLNEDSPPEHM